MGWGGLATLILARVDDGSFGASYPVTCTDGAGPIGTDDSALWNAMRADIPSLLERPWCLTQDEPPSALKVMDIIEFCWRSVGKPIRKDYHSFFTHHHLDFNIDAGRNEFSEAVNRIFRRNGLAFELTVDGRIERLAPPVLREELNQVTFNTGNAVLDGMLESARQKFLDPDEAVRRDALEKLWDAWERLKTLEQGSDKKAQVTVLLDNAAGSGSPKLRDALEEEARVLTKIGNSLQIRHSETTQERLSNVDHVDYLFHRLFAFVQMRLRATGRI